MRHLSEQECQTLSEGHCPTCHYRGYILGPTALGSNFNIECANVKCRDRFNISMHPHAPGVVIFAQAIGNGWSKDVYPWPSEPTQGAPS